MKRVRHSAKWLPSRRLPFSWRVAIGMTGVALSVMLWTPSAPGQGGGVIIYENGSPDMGSSYAGKAARAQDAATAFENPAGMTRIRGNELLLGTFAVISKFRFDPDLGTTVSDPPGETNGGGSFDSFSPALGSFLVLDLAESLKFGFSVNAISAAGVDYDGNWIGRAFVTENSLVIANLEPALAYRFTDWFSLGAGLNLLYINLNQDLKRGSDPAAPTISVDDADDWGVAGTFGALFEFWEETRVGLTFRTQGNLSLKGDIDAPNPSNVNFDTDFDVPMGANLSVYHRLTDQWALLADVGWTDWSHFSQQPMTVGPVSGKIDRDWRDTYRFGIGAEYDLTPTWRFRTGFSIDTSPVSDGHRLPDIPVGEQYRFSLGVQHDFGHATFGLNYTYFYTDLTIDKVLLPPGNTVLLDGDYDQSSVHFIGASVIVPFKIDRPSLESTAP